MEKERKRVNSICSRTRVEPELGSVSYTRREREADACARLSD